MKKSLLIACLLLMGSFSFAQTEAPERELPEESAADKAKAPVLDEAARAKEADSAEDSESELNRENKRFQVSIMPFGLGPNNGNSYGANIGYFINGDSMIQVSVTASNNGISCSGSLSCDYDGTSAGIYYKRFAGNSFYYSGGIDQREVSYKEKSTSGYSPNNFDYGFDGSITALGAVIGNQWQWENFTMGCDWVGVTVPVATKLKNEYNNNPGSSQDTIDSSKNDYVKKVNLQALRFYLGASF